MVLRRRDLHLRAALLSLAATTATVALLGTTAPEPKRVPEGKWGGVGLLLEVGDDGAKVELDGAHGSIDGPLSLDAEGRFEANGTLVRERPGPTRAGGEGAGAEPARYRGTIAGETLTLDLTLTRSGTAIGPLQAKRGAPARLRKMY
jgi:hypothetical protein